MSSELTTPMPPALYRSEAFVEDLELPPNPFEAGAAQRAGARLAAWLLAVPGTVALLAGVVVIATMPA